MVFLIDKGGCLRGIRRRRERIACGAPKHAGRPFENTTLLGQGLYGLGSINHSGCSRLTSSSEPWGVARGEGCAVSRVAWANAPDANANAETKATATIGERIDALLRFDLANFRYGLFE